MGSSIAAMRLAWLVMIASKRFRTSRALAKFSPFAASRPRVETELPLPPADLGLYGLAGFRGHLVAVLFAVHLEDRHQLLGGIVIEVNVFIEARFQAGVAVDEFLHQLRVAGDDDHEILPVILHRLKNRIDGFLPEIIPAVLREGVGFVDKENTALRLLDLLLGFDGSLSHVAGDQPGAVHLHKLPLGEHPDLLIKLREDPGNRSLARSGISGEHKMKRDRDGAKSFFLAKLLGLHKIHQLTYIFLHRRKPDQLIELLCAGLFRLLRLLLIAAGGRRRRLRRVRLLRDIGRVGNAVRGQSTDPRRR